jgi:hypothetical protein
MAALLTMNDAHSVNGAARVRSVGDRRGRGSTLQIEAARDPALPIARPC